MIDQLKSLAVFATVVEEGSFRAAAARLNLSPSVISHHIANLEKKLGVVLFYRSTRVLSLTENGHRLFGSASSMIAAAEDGLSQFSDSADDRLIDLRVAIPSMLAGHPIFERIIRFARDNPGVRLNLLSSDLTQNLLTENIDVGIRVGKMRDADYKARKIGQDHRVIVAAPKLVKRYEELTHPNQLSAWDCISFSAVQDKFSFHKGRSTIDVWGITAAVTDSVATMHELTLAGVGVSGMPFEIVNKDISAKRLVKLLPEWREDVLNVYAVWARNAAISQHTRRFINSLVV